MPFKCPDTKNSIKVPESGRVIHICSQHSFLNGNKRGKLPLKVTEVSEGQ